MKEDVLEQLVEDYLQLNGYFTRHNVRFKPDNQDPRFDRPQHSVPSDIDIIGINPDKRAPEKVWGVSCKSWQKGFSASNRLEKLQNSGRNARREIWRDHRELWDGFWAESFRRRIKEITGQSTFHYWIAVTKLVGSQTNAEKAAASWASNPTIKANLAGSKFSFLEFKTVWEAVKKNKDPESGDSPAASEIGRLVQLMRAAGV